MVSREAFAFLLTSVWHRETCLSLPVIFLLIVPRQCFFYVSVFCVCLCHTVLSVCCSLVVTCWERPEFLALLFVMFSCDFVTFSFGVLGQVWYLIVSIPDMCLLPYFGS